MPSWRTNQERRRWRRHWLRAPVRILSDAGAIDGFGLRVSEGGMYLFAVADLDVGTQVEVEFKKPHSGEPSRCSGVVRNRVVYLYGLEFLPDKAQSSHLQRAPEAAIKS
jgi:PilZ domain